MAIDGPALRLWRERTGWQATAFAAELRISVQYLCDIESGRRLLKRNPDLIRRMASLLKIPTSMLSMGEEVA